VADPQQQTEQELEQEREREQEQEQERERERRSQAMEVRLPQAPQRARAGHPLVAVATERAVW